MTSEGGELDVLLVGPYPPPLGGVSSHVRRLAEVLAGERLRIAVLNHFGGEAVAPVVGTLNRNPLRYLRQVPRFGARVVHYHHARLSTLVAIALTRRRQPRARYIVTIHEQSLLAYLPRRIAGRLARWSLRRFDEIVAVSPEIADALRGALGEPRLHVVPAYLPHERGPSDGLDERARQLLGGEGTTLVVSAYRAVPDRGGGDAYGLDIAVDTFAKLAGETPDLRLAVFLAQEPSVRRAQRYLRGLLARLAAEGLGERAAVFTGLDLTPAFDHRVVLLRPSRTEGDAVSVREALHAGVPVVASDAVQRPEGVVSIPLDDHQAWLDSVRHAIRAGPDARHAPVERVGDGPHEHARTLLQLYGHHPPSPLEAQRGPGREDSTPTSGPA